jgi:Cd2+/Zn2+-exporting ATPase
MRCGKLDVDVLMLLAAAGAALVGHWVEGAVLLFLFSLGNTLETYAFRRTHRSIQSLARLHPDTASLVTGSEERIVRLEALTAGDLVRVRPAERIPIDGDVVSGSSHVDESTLTGEPIPAAKGVDDAVFAGTLNGSGSLDVRVTRTAGDTTLARIIRMVEEARQSQSPTQSWIERVEGRYALGVILAATAAVLIPWLALGWTLDASFYRAMTLLVVASPCALVISIPATIVSAVANGARHGILFKGGAHLDALAAVRTFALDKTGTVTVGRPDLVAVRTLALTPAGASEGSTVWSVDAGQEATGEAAILRLVAAAESRSEHHIAAAIVRAATERGIALADSTESSVSSTQVRRTTRIFINSRQTNFGTATSPTCPRP